MEDDLQKRPSMKENVQWKMTFHGRQLWYKMTYDGKWPLLEDDLR